MRPPLRLLVPAALAGLFLIVPLIGLLTQAPWGRLVSLLTSETALQALWLSLWTSTAALGVCIAGGLPLGWVLARVSFPGRRVLRGMVLTPLVLPPVVAGVALLAAFGRTGLIGAPLRAWFGTAIPYTSLAVVLAHAFVAMPFFVIAAETAFRSTPQQLDDLAGTMGSDRWHTFSRVTLPLALPGLAAGAVLAWARSLGEFGATITFAGNYPGSTRTLPLDVYTQLQTDRDTAVALSLLLFAVCVTVLVLLRERWWGAIR